MLDTIVKWRSVKYGRSRGDEKDIGDGLGNLRFQPSLTQIPVKQSQMTVVVPKRLSKRN